jgi:hypothetical protein
MGTDQTDIEKTITEEDNTTTLTLTLTLTTTILSK